MISKTSVYIEGTENADDCAVKLLCLDKSMTCNDLQSPSIAVDNIIDDWV